MMILLNSNGNLIFSRESGRYHINSNPTLLIVKSCLDILFLIKENQEVLEIHFQFYINCVI